MKIFKDRQAAGLLLANRLKKTKADLVLAIPRGGVVVGKEIADNLKLPLDVIVTRKIGAPNQPELALGAVDPDGEVVWDNELLSQLQLKIKNLKFKIEEEIEEIKRRTDVYRGRKEPLDVAKKTVILVDDGIATGATTLSAIGFLKRRKAKKIILAIPVASNEAIEKITRELGNFGEVLVLHTPEYFQAVGQFYQEFESVEDEEVIQLLA